MMGQGVPVVLPTTFSYPVPKDTNASVAVVSAQASFISFLGFPTCSVGDVAPTRLVFPEIYPTGLSPVVDSSSQSSEAAIPSNTPSAIQISASTGSPKVTRGGIAAIGALVPVTLLTFIATGIWLLRKTMKRRRIPAGQHKTHDETEEQTRDETPAFLQQKPELQGEPSRQEMDAEERRYELHAEDTCEMFSEDDRQGRGNGRLGQELRGEEAARQLEGDEQ